MGKKQRAPLHHPDNYRVVRAVFDEHKIRVYQAYSHLIADAALKEGTFVSPSFSMTRTTWIKPSFLWMMYRSGWGMKDNGQRRILAIDISRGGFDWALAHANLAHYDVALPYPHDQWRERLESSAVVVQWDPERDTSLRPLDHRAIQVGLKEEAVKRYVTDWIVKITDVTELASEIHHLLDQDDSSAVKALLPVELAYPVQAAVAKNLLMSQPR